MLDGWAGRVEMFGLAGGGGTRGGERFEQDAGFREAPGINGSLSAGEVVDGEEEHG